MAERSVPVTSASARELSRWILARRCRTVLLDGPSGSGKSTFAHALVKQIRLAPGAPSVALVQMDDLYPGWSGLDRASQESARLLVRPHARGLAAHWRPWNWAAGTTAGRRVVRESVLLLEGCGSAGADARRHADLVVWLTAGDELRKTRALTRDGELFAAHWDAWDRSFRSYCERERPRGGADLVLDSGGDCVVGS